MRSLAFSVFCREKKSISKVFKYFYCMAWIISGGITQHNWSICAASFASMPASDCGFSGSFGGNTSVLIKSKNRRELGIFIEVLLGCTSGLHVTSRRPCWLVGTKEYYITCYRTYTNQDGCRVFVLRVTGDQGLNQDLELGCPNCQFGGVFWFFFGREFGRPKSNNNNNNNVYYLYSAN